ncbi:hypothetical protein H6P81_016302 [Aristolochia fimbriata]|uniref:Uncharacterized protein n=1 Tax=Aristolochia fimbriata TaxID=158543 RepID=A0AAV7EB53_ARIFI|nr:hypothetical protein H6P81_016302 [Aristolochia fimbriata]
MDGPPHWGRRDDGKRVQWYPPLELGSINRRGRRRNGSIDPKHPIFGETHDERKRWSETNAYLRSELGRKEHNVGVFLTDLDSIISQDLGSERNGKTELDETDAYRLRSCIGRGSGREDRDE